MSYTVKVSNLSPGTTEGNLKDFFSFCGTITSIHHDPITRSATIHFEKSSAAKTALMLNGGNLNDAHLEVTSDTVHVDDPEHHDTHHHSTSGPGIDQTDKPRAGIAAEYLANGYTLSDSILQRAIEVDNKHGISRRFLNYFQSLDAKLGSRVVGPDMTISGKVQEALTDAQAKAKEIDQQKGFSKTAESYYQQALSHPLGQKVFYTTTSKQVADIHEEARRIANHRAQATPTSTSSAPQPQPSATIGKDKLD
ncbi:hypothetical protein Clacol_009959 [Clathrus columnatus]|uniref:RRM domain-containing protein n=1 Tax=Clathrus columnatus TaxID=1419009 RepID=A0AAV5ATL6_9AGAM|nr:hypothetical protein Clacol_009959 [Clathrus columnatus]